MSEPDFMNNNTIKLYYELDRKMMKAHHEETDDGDATAIATAHTLLDNADLPLILRVRACHVLGCSDEEGFLDWAKEGLRIARLIMERSDDPSDVVKKLVADSEKVVREAEEAKKEQDAETETEQAEETRQAAEGPEQTEGPGEVESKEHRSTSEDEEEEQTRERRREQDHQYGCDGVAAIKGYIKSQARRQAA